MNRSYQFTNSTQQKQTQPNVMKISHDFNNNASSSNLVSLKSSSTQPMRSNINYLSYVHKLQAKNQQRNILNTSLEDTKKVQTRAVHNPEPIVQKQASIKNQVNNQSNVIRAQAKIIQPIRASSSYPYSTKTSNQLNNSYTGTQNNQGSQNYQTTQATPQKIAQLAQTTQTTTETIKRQPSYSFSHSSQSVGNIQNANTTQTFNRITVGNTQTPANSTITPQKTQQSGQKAQTTGQPLKRETSVKYITPIQLSSLTQKVGSSAQNSRIITEAPKQSTSNNPIQIQQIVQKPFQTTQNSSGQQQTAAKTYEVNYKPQINNTITLRSSISNLNQKQVKNNTQNLSTAQNNTSSLANSNLNSQSTTNLLTTQSGLYNQYAQSNQNTQSSSNLLNNNYQSLQYSQTPQINQTSQNVRNSQILDQNNYNTQNVRNSQIIQNTQNSSSNPNVQNRCSSQNKTSPYQSYQSTTNNNHNQNSIQTSQAYQNSRVYQNNLQNQQQALSASQQQKQDNLRNSQKKAYAPYTSAYQQFLKRTQSKNQQIVFAPQPQNQQALTSSQTFGDSKRPQNKQQLNNSQKNNKHNTSAGNLPGLTRSQSIYYDENNRLQINLQEQANIFSQFKVKYDELKMNYDKLRTQFDDMNRQKKKMEIKLLNNNPQYYDKEIKRLRAELEKYQQQNQDNKYKFLQAENAKKQFEATSKVKQQQLQQILKQLQKQKINNVELKHQNNQKQRVFSRIRMQFDRSSDNHSKNYDQAVSRANKLDGALKTKNAQYDQLVKNYDRLQRRLNQTKEEHKKYRQINEQKFKTLNKTIQTKNSQAFKTRTETNNKIRQLSQQIQKYKSQRASVELLKTKKSEQVQMIKSNRQLQLDVVRLEDRIRDLEYQLVQKDEMIVELQKTIDKVKLQQQIKQLQQKIQQLQDQKMDMSRQFEKQKGQLIRQLDKYKIQSINTPGRIFGNTNKDFQEILKVQLEQNAKLKRQLTFKIDEIYNLKSDIDEIKVQKQNLMSEMQVLKKMKKAEQKNIMIQSQVASQYLKNDLQSYKRKVEVLEEKLNLKIKQVKDKDQFIMNSVLGRSKPEDTQLIHADFQRIFQANYIQKLAQANKRIADFANKK